MTKKAAVKVLNIADYPLTTQAIRARDAHVAELARLVAVNPSAHRTRFEDVQDYLVNPSPPDLTVTGFKNIIKPIVEDYWNTVPNGMANDLLYKLFDIQHMVYSPTTGASKDYYYNKYWPRADGSYMEKAVNEITYRLADKSGRFVLIYEFRRMQHGWGEFSVPSRQFILRIRLEDKLLPDRTCLIYDDKICHRIASTTDSTAAYSTLFKNLLNDFMHSINSNPKNDLVNFFQNRRKQAALYDVYL